MTKEYVSKIYSAEKAFAFLFPALMATVFLVVTIAHKFHYPTVGMVLLLASGVGPFFFEEKIKKFFSRKIVLQFDERGFSIDEYSLFTDRQLAHTASAWEDLRGYKAFISQSTITYMTLYLATGKKRYGFKDKKTTDEALSDTSVFGVFRAAVKQYNTTHPDKHQIVMMPGFATTRGGMVFLIFLWLLVALFGALTLWTRSIVTGGPLMVVFVLALGASSKRGSDRDFYEKYRIY